MPSSVLYADDQVVVGAFIQPGSPGAALFQDFARNLAEADTKLRLDLFIHGEVGNEQEVFAAVRRGRIEIGSFTSVTMAKQVPEMVLLEAPYLFASLEEANFVLENFVIDVLTERLSKRGLRLIRWLDLGFLCVYGKTPIRLPGDAQGMKLRASPSKASQGFLQAIGADLIFAGSPDVLPGLQTGLLVGGENLIITYEGTGLEDEAPYFTLTNHSYLAAAVLANEGWFSALPAQDRTAIMNAFPDRNASRRLARDFHDERIRRARAGPISIVDLDAEHLDEWRAATASVSAELVESLGEDGQKLMDTIEQGKTAYKAQDNSDVGASD